MKRSVVLGTSEGQNVDINLDALVRTRLLVQASSGAGKSWLLRRLLEQSHGAIQHIVLDPEGEFSTLRERFDYVLVGTGGEVSADIRSAPLLARRLMELNVSAVVDLFETEPSKRKQFVHVFLDALINLPKDLWHPCLVVVDEAHVFAPEKGHGESEALDSVIGLASRGRKRGYAALLATQSIAKLHKDAAGECHNKLIGRTVLDIHRARAAKELGFRTSDQELSLRSLKAGHFFAFGPAISTEIIEVHVGAIQTTHPEIGSKAAPLPPPREKVRAILSKLADLPKDAEDEARSLDDLRRQIREKDREIGDLKRQAKMPTVAPKVERIEVPILKADHLKKLLKCADTLFRAGEHVGRIAGLAIAESKALSAVLAETTKRSASVPGPQWPPVVAEGTADPRPRMWPQGTGQPGGVARDVMKHLPSELASKLGKADKLILSVLSQYPQGRTVTQVAILTGYAVDGGAFRNPLGKLRSADFIEGGRGDVLRITEAGREAIEGHWSPLPPPGRELLDHWMRRLGHAEREILRVLASAYPNSLTAEQIATETRNSKGEPYEANGGAFRNPLGRLRTLELAIGRGSLRLSDTLMV